MKKLLTVALGAILLCGIAGCGASYDKTVLAVSGDDAQKSFHAVGGFGGVDGTWSPTEANKMEATSVAEVAKLDKKLAIPIIMCKNLTIFPSCHLYHGFAVVFFALVRRKNSTNN